MDEIASLTRAQLDALAEQIAILSLRIDVAKHELLTHLRKFDAHDGWANSGFVSLAAWLAWRIDISPVAAREHVRVARALGELQRIDAAFAAGKLSYSKVRAITRVATPETEQDFLDVSTNATASQIERLSSAYRRTRIGPGDPGEPALDQRRFVRRSDTASGMIRIEAQLPPEQAAIVWEALSATPLPVHIARMLACDCSRVDVEVGESGEILDVGRARRTIPSAIGRALWLRDGGCRAPGCSRRHHLHAHHIEEWADGGKTAASNLVLLCPGHHLQVHEGNLSVQVREGKLVFENRHGLKLEPVPARCADADFEEVERWLHTAEPGFDRAGTPVWDGSRLHLGVAIDALYAAQRSRVPVGM
jgi:hypothetical protein